MHTPSMGGGGAVPSHLYKYPSQSSIHSMVSMGHLPPGHGYIPKKPKPDKPYGPTFVSVMNRTWRGPGRKYINYAIAFISIGLLFFAGGALYFGHRNVARLKVLHTEVLGALMVAVGVMCVAAVFYMLNRAREESNKWRAHVRFRPQGLFTAAAVNYAYVPEEEVKLASGTYGPRALKEVPRPTRSKGGRGRSTAGNLSRPAAPPSTSGPQQARMFEKKDHKPSPLVLEEQRGMDTVVEGQEPDQPLSADYQSRLMSSRSFDMEQTGYDDEYQKASTLPMTRPSPEPVRRPSPETMTRPSPEPVRRPYPEPARRPSPEPVRRPYPDDTPRSHQPFSPQAMSTMETPVHRPPPQPVFRPTPQAWRSGGSTTSDTPPGAAAPAPRTFSPPASLPTVTRNPVSSRRPPPQPTINLGGMRQGSSESEL